MRLLSIGTLLLAVAAGCAPPPPLPERVESTLPQGPDVPRSVDQLIEALRTLPGDFRFIDPEQTGYMFTGSEALFRQIAALDSVAVPKLIDCFGQADPTAATLDGQPVPIAVLCFQAFIRTRWFQARRRTRTLPMGAQGVGAVRLRSTPEQLVRARDWWRVYLAAGAPLGRQ
jgi:hypothetical protein